MAALPVNIIKKPMDPVESYTGSGKVEPPNSQKLTMASHRQKQTGNEGDWDLRTS
jgi:hypothetical protein